MYEEGKKKFNFWWDFVHPKSLKVVFLVELYIFWFYEWAYIQPPQKLNKDF